MSKVIAGDKEGLMKRGKVAPYVCHLASKVDLWDDVESYPRADWQAEVAASDTQRGYWDWVAAQMEQEDD